MWDWGDQVTFIILKMCTITGYTVSVQDIISQLLTFH